MPSWWFYVRPIRWKLNSTTKSNYKKYESLGQFLCSWICSPFKKYPSVRSHEFSSEMLDIGLARRMSRSFLQDLSRAVSRFSRGPVAGNHRQHFFDPTGSNTITNVHRIEKMFFFDPIGNCNPVGSKKRWRWFPVTGPLEKREAALGRSWRKLRLILRRGRPIADMFGAKNSCERTEWKVLFRRTANPTA